jgi:hypothetical protein
VQEMGAEVGKGVEVKCRRWELRLVKEYRLSAGDGS